MQVKSLVVCLRLEIHPENKPFVKWIPVADEKTIYTVRDIIPKSHIAGHTEDGVYLEEGVVGFTPYGYEITIPISWLREVQGPGELDLEAIMKEEEVMAY
jgi:hypothetical protein